MDSLPAPGSLVAAYSALDKMWHRAMVRECSEGEVEVFLVDKGSTETVTLNDIRRLDPCFSVYPFQAILACLAHVEPAGSSWEKRSTNFFKSLVKSHYVEVKISF